MQSDNDLEKRRARFIIYARAVSWAINWINMNVNLFRVRSILAFGVPFSDKFIFDPTDLLRVK